MMQPCLIYLHVGISFMSPIILFPVNSTYQLEYLTLRALADLPVLMLEESGLAYTAVYWSKEGA